MKKQIISALLTLPLTISLAAGLSFADGIQTQAYTTLDSSQDSELSSTSPFTSSTYYHAEGFDGKRIYHGIDVSYHNGTIDWNDVADAGVEYAFIRAGYRGYGNGSLNQDSKFSTYAPAAIQAGIPIGVYYFTEATTEQEAIEEAQDCIRIIEEANVDVTLPIALDYEYQYNTAGQLVSPKAKISKTQATANCRAFCDTIAASGYTPIIYANKSDLSSLIDGAALSESYGIWLANYTTTTTYSGSYQIWQYTSSGKVDGISGKTDCNFWYTDGDLKDAISLKTLGDLKNATISSISSQTYSGKALKPAPTVKMGSKTLKAGVHYKVTYTNNTKPGKATATITGIGRYTGTKSKTFKINPAAVRSLTAATTANKIKLTWKGSSAYSGYEVYRSTTYNGSYKKIKTVKNKTSLTNKKLSKEREYYYKVRAYATVNGKAYYGPYTKITAGAISGVRAALNKSARALLKKPSAKSAKRATIPFGATIRYLGKTVLKNQKKFYHVQYKKGGKVYDGYLISKKGLTFRKAKLTTAKVKLRSQPGTNAYALATVPKNQPVILRSHKKKNGVTWYETYYLKGKHLYSGYISGSYLN